MSAIRRSILMLAPCPFPTAQGTQVMIRHLATALAAAGHAVHLVTYGHGELPFAPDPPFFVHRAARVDTGLRSGPSLAKPIADAALLQAAYRVGRAHDCQLIHGHNVEGLALGLILKRTLRRPLVYHAHNAMGPELPTYFGASWARALAAVAGRVIDRTLPRGADATIVFDAAHRRFLEARGVAANRLFEIPPGLDDRELGGADERTIDALARRIGKGPWVLYAGNADAYQNLELLGAALARVRAVRPEARLLVITHHDASAFAALAGVLTGGEGVTILQQRSVDELRAAFRLAAIGVCPRVLWTGAPIKILNYLAVGLPVVACRSGAQHTLPANAGRLVEPTPAAFAAAILETLSESGEQQCRRARAAFARFRIAAHVPRYEQVYDWVTS